jgi:thiol-disulfide isomerase/thioredoxin
MLFRLPCFAALVLLAGCGSPDANRSTGDRIVVYSGENVTIQAVTAEDLAREVQALRSDLVVVNFWASWCAPCREEFPDFIQFDREHADVAVRFVSIDFEDDLPHAVSFLREQGFTGTTYLRTGRDAPFIDAVSEDWTGALPATAVYDRNGTRLAFWEGKVSYDELAQRVNAARLAL